MRVGRHEVAITNPDKVFFPEPGLTKGDLVDYYLAVAPCALHHIRRRPFHMKRYPHGVEGEFFHQKRVPAHPDFVGEQFVQFPSGHSTVFAVVDNGAALAWVVNLGCIELHTWHSRVDDIERPDYLLIDLDRRGVFVDFGQNARDRTIASAYSVRPTADARVSAPLDWKEVARSDPARFTVKTMRKRIAKVGDPTAGMWRRKASLLPRFDQLGLEPGNPELVERRSGRS